MQEVLDLLREADAKLCSRINVRCDLGATAITDPILRRLLKAHEGIWDARRALGEQKEATCLQ